MHLQGAILCSVFLCARIGQSENSSTRTLHPEHQPLRVCSSPQKSRSNRPFANKKHVFVVHLFDLFAQFSTRWHWASACVSVSNNGRPQKVNHGKKYCAARGFCPSATRGVIWTHGTGVLASRVPSRHLDSEWAPKMQGGSWPAVGPWAPGFLGAQIGEARGVDFRPRARHEFVFGGAWILAQGIHEFFSGGAWIFFRGVMDFSMDFFRGFVCFLHAKVTPT